MTKTDSNGLYRMGVVRKVVYGVGAVSDTIKTFSFTTFLLFYYTTVLGLPGTLLGLAMSVGLVWDAAVDPFIGHLSDRTLSKLGRRHTFMFVGAVCAGASFIAVFNPPAGLSTTALFAWLMVSSLCLRSSNSLFMVPYLALGAELATDYHERTSVSGYRTGATLVGTPLVIAAAFLVFLPGGTAGEGDAKFLRESYASMGVAFGIAMIVTGLAAAFGTLHERHRLRTPAAAPVGSFALRRTVFDALRDVSLRALVWSICLATIGSALNAALTLYFLTYYARIDANQSFTWYYGGFYAGALAGIFAWVRTSIRFEKHHIYAATTVVTAVVMSGGYWLVGDGRPLGTGNLWALVAGNAVAGFFGVGAAVMIPSMLADMTARDELQSGTRRDGIFFGIYSFSQQLSGGVAVLAGGVLLDRFAGLLPGQAEQSPLTIERLAIISNLLPAALLAGAGLVALRYRLTRQQLYSTPSARAAAQEQPSAVL